jgi:RNase P subunit RPR2
MTETSHLVNVLRHSYMDRDDVAFEQTLAKVAQLTNLSADSVRAWMRNMTSDERMELIRSIRAAFCWHCGRELSENETCHCWNDE